MKQVAASEHDLLNIVRALLGYLEPAAVAPLLRREQPLAPRFGPTALGLLRDTLAKGAVLALCRRGGWTSAEHLDGAGQLRKGRLWERQPAPELRFGLATLELCRYLTSTPLGSLAAPPFSLRGGDPTAADELVFYLACQLAQRCDCGGALARSPALRRSALCWLGFADLLSATGPPTATELDAAAWSGLLAGPRAVLLEALQPDLARRWVEMERHKGQLGSVARLVQLGQAQRLVLEGLAPAADQAGRRDLLSFVWRAAGRLLRHRPEATSWVGSLGPESSLQERSHACREGGAAFLRELLHLQRWIEEARGRRFFDDDYPAAQLLLREWEELGAAGSQHAQQVVQALESLEAVTRAAAPAP